MTWVKLDDGFTDHPKVVGLSDKAFRVHVRALCYCARFAPGVGTIPATALPQLGATKAVVAELIKARLWDEEDGALTVHDFSEYHPKPDKRAAAGRLGGVASGEARRSKREAFASENRSNYEASASENDEAKRSSHVDARAEPDPTRPDPERSSDLSSQPGLPASREAARNTLSSPIAQVFKSAESLIQKNLNDIETELLMERCEDFPPERVKQAIETARAAGKRSLQYAYGILERWAKEGFPETRSAHVPTQIPVRNAAPPPTVTAEHIREMEETQKRRALKEAARANAG